MRDKQATINVMNVNGVDTQNNESVGKEKKYYVSWWDSQTIPLETVDMTILEEVRYYTKM